NHTGVSRAPGGASLWEAGAFRTPLGDVSVDDGFARALLETSPLVGPDHDAHASEHAVEVELPFLQIRRADVRIVPLVLAWDAWEGCRGLGETLAGLVRRWPDRVLLLASSDLNHYEPAATSERKDRRALDAVTALDGAELLARCRSERISMCGRAPTATVMAAARALGAGRADVVHYSHSGMVTGDGGDGWVVARALHVSGIPVWVAALDPKTDDAIDNRALARMDGVRETGREEPWPATALVIDALLGTGAAGPARGDVLALAQRLVAYGAPVLAIDGPTGLDLSSGEVHGPVRAELSVTFGGPRRGHLLAREWCGKIVVVDIGLPPADPVWPLLVTDGWAGARLPKLTPTM